MTRCGLSGCVQVQYSLLDRRPANVMADFCLAHNIGLLPYGVLAGGFLSDRYMHITDLTGPKDTIAYRKTAMAYAITIM